MGRSARDLPDFMMLVPDLAAVEAVLLARLRAAPTVKIDSLPQA